MKRVAWLATALLLLYSITLLVTEHRTSQDFVRNFFSDIEGRYPLFGINTTISVCFLWGAALIFLICCRLSQRSGGVPVDQRTLFFYVSQILVFGFLGFDDRFLVHEELGKRLGIEDALIIGGLGVVEMASLIWLGGLIRMDRPRKVVLLLAALFTGATVLIDALAPSEAPLRLSFEDLAKTWGAAFLFLFAWLTMERELEPPPP